MKKISEFVEHLHEVFAEFGHIEAKRMFGGYGLYREGLMFGLVAADVLYLKADEGTVELFIGLNLPPFEYEKAGKTMKIAYYQAPEELFDDPQVAKQWAELALGAAVRAKNTQGKRRKASK